MRKKERVEEGGREGGKEGEREGGKEGEREGGREALDTLLQSVNFSRVQTRQEIHFIIAFIIGGR